jgi:hypothetical protein
MLGSERYMTPHNVRFTTFDPAVDNILQQLKSCNKQAAFVRDSIIYYLGSKQGRQAADLMCRKKPTKRPAATTSVRSEAKQGTDGVLELSESTISLSLMANLCELLQIAESPHINQFLK